MEADFAVELGADDETLEMPWASAELGMRYYDLKHQPQCLALLEEAQRAPELRSFLEDLNQASGLFESAKCDLYASDQIFPEEEIFAARIKFGGYVDLLFSLPESRFSFAAHERAARDLAGLLARTPAVPAAAELLVRRCYYRQEPAGEGFYITLYLFGFGPDEPQARRHWGEGLRITAMAIRQLSGS